MIQSVFVIIGGSNDQIEKLVPLKLVTVAKKKFTKKIGPQRSNAEAIRRA